MGATARQADRVYRRGCTIALLLIGLSTLIFILLPYRAETVVGVVNRNRTGCTIDVTHTSEWQDEKLGPALYASNVEYPLEVFVFVHGCSNLDHGKPYSAELIAAESGEIVAKGLSCGTSADQSYPCRLEAAPIPLRSSSHRYVVCVKRTSDQPAREAELEVTTSRCWRSFVLDAILSV